MHLIIPEGDGVGSNLKQVKYDRKKKQTNAWGGKRGNYAIGSWEQANTSVDTQRNAKETTDGLRLYKTDKKRWASTTVFWSVHQQHRLRFWYGCAQIYRKNYRTFMVNMVVRSKILCVLKKVESAVHGKQLKTLQMTSC